MASPVICAIDTATERCSVAVLHANGVVEVDELVGQKHSERVLPLVDAVLSKAGLTLGGVDAFAFGAGPGSFTGLRIACGVVQGLAYARARPVIPVGNLRALAATAFARHPESRVVLAAIDARMHETYCAAYRNDASLTELRAPAVESPAALAAIVDEIGADLVAGDALATFAEACAPITAARLPDARGSAAGIARLAALDLAAGRGVSAAEAMPVYVRDRVALTIDERRAKVNV
jgi:tRNA threonylcarbamoyladenosine biosynthesis protein TsaB